MSPVYGSDGKPVRLVLKRCLGKLKLKGITATADRGQYTLLATLLTNYPRPSQQSTLPPAQKQLSYSSRRLSCLLSQPALDWPTADRPFLIKCLLHSNESIDLVHRLTLRFKWLMQNRLTEELPDWCADAERIPILRGFVRGIRQDFAAVAEAFRSEWSNGPQGVVRPKRTPCGASKPIENHKVNDVWQSEL